MSKKQTTTEIVTELVQPITDELGLDLWDVLFEKEGASWYLRIIIDKADGVTLNDCENVSRKVSEILDEVDPIEQSYYLDVASAGLGRALRKPKHYEYAKGQEIKIITIRPVDGEKEFKGILKDFTATTLIIEQDSQTREMQISDCAKIKLNDDENLF